MEAEYRVLTQSAKDVVYLQTLMVELNIGNNESTLLFNDNQSCIKLVTNPILHARTKHIKIQHHFRRE